MRTRASSPSATVVCNFRLLIVTAGIVTSLWSADAAPAIADVVLAATFDYTTVNGTAKANSNVGVSGLPIAATTVFDKSLLDAPLTDADDPLGTARHELFHGVGFAEPYNFFFSHIYTPASGPLTGMPVFNQLTNTLGNDLLVLAPDFSHDVASNFNGQGNGGTLLNQTFFLMTPGPIPGAPVPYAIDQRDIAALNAAFNWTGSGGLTINVVFDNSVGTWTAAEKAVVNQAKNNVQAAFGPVTSTNVFTWTVQVSNAQVPEPSSALLAVFGVAGLVAYRWRRSRSGLC